MLGGMEGRRRRRRRRAAAGVCFGRVVARGGRGEGVAGLGEKEGKRRAILARWAGPGGLDGWIGGCVRDTNIRPLIAPTPNITLKLNFEWSLSC